ncbi:MAG: DUF3089 domain-containing protein, partial [Robiginitomaculum sp.]|nr:DUF3089 domain-containing protein [Robiginitomaculum sp.]
NQSKSLIPLVAILIAIFWAVLIVLASWFTRDSAFQTIYDPRQPFQTYNPAPALDYTAAKSWLIRPDQKQDPVEIEGGDIFVVYPTLYLGADHWNAPTNNIKVINKLQRIALPNFIMPFASSGRLYAPIYRQAALYSFLNYTRDDSKSAQRLAYRDVKRAFDVFLRENPPERPIILVGYGQGGLHIQKLMGEYFQGSLHAKLAAAYVIDHPLPIDVFENALAKLHPCESKFDIHCVISFGAFAPNEKRRMHLYHNKTNVWDRHKLITVQGRPLLCTNPLLWTRSEDYAPAKLHLGGVSAEGLGVDMLPSPSTQQTGAQCQDGLMMIDKPKQKSLRRPSRFGGKFRTPPSNLFYEDLRVDAARRVQTLIQTNILPKLAPVLNMQTIEIEESPVTLPTKTDGGN